VAKSDWANSTADAAQQLQLHLPLRIPNIFKGPRVGDICLEMTDREHMDRGPEFISGRHARELAKVMSQVRGQVIKRNLIWPTAEHRHSPSTHTQNKLMNSARKVKGAENL